MSNVKCQLGTWKLEIGNSCRKQGGFAAISVVLILTAVVLAVATTVALLSIGEGQSGLSLYKGEDNLATVEGCVEDVMLKIRSNSSFSGASVTHPDVNGNTVTCTFTYLTTDPNWDIKVSTSGTNYTRTIEIKFTRNATGITLTSWQEVSS